MEQASDQSLYSSDEWEDSDDDHSDTDDDHSDSSDDDDPKSQVDRLIERGTLMFMDDENSALSSQSESDDSDYDYDDSESDITDVSPLISATASPIGLSPVLPRRTLTTSPLALPHPSFTHDHVTQDSHHPADTTNMSLLVQAVMELEKKGKKRRSRQQRSKQHPSSIHPIHDSPHHRHLTRKSSSSSCRRKNMSFTNDEVRRIDRDNRILLKKIMTANSRTNSHHHHTNNHHSHHHHHHHHHRTVHHHRPANATINRKKDDDKIRRDNLILLRKIQEAKPSKEVAEARPPRHRHSGGSYGRSPSHTLSSAGSCSLSARAIHPVTTPPPRKETAL